MGLEHDIKILTARVMHHRLKPKQNKFLYSVYYLSLPFNVLNTKKGNWLLGFNRPALLSFYAKDHGKGKQPLKEWMDTLLLKGNITNAHRDGIRLITMPRVLGYGFNPVSFWIVPDAHGHLLSVICEVNNTFGERHIYICTHSEGHTIAPTDVMEASKVFHVSPFIERDGSYQFRFSVREDFFAAFIDHMDAENSPLLLTSVSGKMKPANIRNLISTFLRYPIIPVQVIFLIHWQAAILFLKGIKYIPKPEQNEQIHTLAKSNR